MRKTKADNLEKIIDSLFPKTKKALLELFFTYPNELFYLTDIFRKVGGGRSTVQKALVTLTDSGILKTERKGRYKYFQANRESQLFPELISLANKILASKLRHALKTGNGIKIAFIYGSVAKGEANLKSDIDIMVIGDIKFGDIVGRLFKLQFQLRREINPNVFTLYEFKERLRANNHFISRIYEGEKVFIIGDEDELKRMGE